ncbi:hypothetical protein RFI_29142 [Reticulomyxa filosa]|uniref:Uncharacterized protein n=1 Tax=Reticulomyxa filosa TaxID=46433 RepID=X6M3P3_RETFI|nr:hypothetical protein RFI_29142 [Reticulomyxa filosa]|eukprot:ETO08246.1 hypothetical protein RFI_29142 [Reticulomyxa filosa]
MSQLITEIVLNLSETQVTWTAKKLLNYLNKKKLVHCSQLKKLVITNNSNMSTLEFRSAVECGAFMFKFANMKQSGTNKKDKVKKMVINNMKEKMESLQSHFCVINMCVEKRSETPMPKRLIQATTTLPKVISRYTGVCLMEDRPSEKQSQKGVLELHIAVEPYIFGDDQTEPYVTKILIVQEDVGSITTNENRDIQAYEIRLKRIPHVIKLKMKKQSEEQKKEEDVYVWTNPSDNETVIGAKCVKSKKSHILEYMGVPKQLFEGHNQMDRIPHFKSVTHAHVDECIGKCWIYRLEFFKQLHKSKFYRYNHLDDTLSTIFGPLPPGDEDRHVTQRPLQSQNLRQIPSPYCLIGMHEYKDWYYSPYLFGDCDKSNWHVLKKWAKRIEQQSMVSFVLHTLLGCLSSHCFPSVYIVEDVTPPFLELLQKEFVQGEHQLIMTLNRMIQSACGHANQHVEPLQLRLRLWHTESRRLSAWNWYQEWMLTTLQNKSEQKKQELWSDKEKTLIQQCKVSPYLLQLSVSPIPQSVFFERTSSTT